MPGAHKMKGKACSPTSQGEQTHKSKANQQHKKKGLALAGGKEYQIETSDLVNKL